MRPLKHTLLHLVTFIAGALALLLMVFIGWVSLPFDANNAKHAVPVAGTTTSTVSADNTNSAMVGSAQTSEALASIPLSDVKQLPSMVREQAIKMNRMQSELLEAQEARAELNLRVESLNTALDTLQRQQQENVEQLASMSISASNNSVAQQTNRRAGQRGLITSEQQYENLINAGVEQTLALSIKQQQDTFELKRLELVDQAVREGWRGTVRFRTAFEELIASRQSIRDELGDEAYDNYLYTSGAQNRVVIVNVINGSAAQIAGMQVGDVVLEYAGSRIYSTRTLQQATREGVRGESIMVLVQREGSTFTTEVARGPLGVSLESSSVQPGSF